MAAITDRNRCLQHQQPADDPEDTDNDDCALRTAPVVRPRRVDRDDEPNDRCLFNAAVGCGNESAAGLHHVEQQQDETTTQPAVAVSRGPTSMAIPDGHTSAVDLVNGNVESIQSRLVTLKNVRHYQSKRVVSSDTASSWSGLTNAPI